MKQYTHLSGNLSKLQRVMIRRKNQINELGFTYHMQKDDIVILETGKIKIKDVKELISLIGASLGDWSLIHHFGKGNRYEATMTNKIINSEQTNKA